MNAHTHTWTHTHVLTHYGFRHGALSNLCSESPWAHMFSHSSGDDLFKWTNTVDILEHPIPNPPSWPEQNQIQTIRTVSDWSPKSTCFTVVTPLPTPFPFLNVLSSASSHKHLLSLECGLCRRVTALPWKRWKTLPSGLLKLMLNITYLEKRPAA